MKIFNLKKYAKLPQIYPGTQKIDLPLPGYKSLVKERIAQPSEITPEILYRIGTVLSVDLNSLQKEITEIKKIDPETARLWKEHIQQKMKLINDVLDWL